MSQLKHKLQKLSQQTFFLPVIVFILTIAAGLIVIHNEVVAPNQMSQVQPSSSATQMVGEFTNKYGRTEQINLEVARTAAEHENGLMYRTSLDPNSGMIFIFDTTAPITFWMKNTFIPLDMIFLDENLKVVKITADAKPDQTTETYPSGVPVKYVIEANADWAKLVGLEVGMNIILR